MTYFIKASLFWVELFALVSCSSKLSTQRSGEGKQYPAIIGSEIQKTDDITHSKYSSSSEVRLQAILKGLDFIFRLSKDKKAYTEDGDEFLWAFYVITTTAVEHNVRARAKKYGGVLAKQWLDTIQHFDIEQDIDLVWSLATNLFVIEKLGFSCPQLRQQLEKIIPRFSTTDWLSFDPLKEKPHRKKYILQNEEACLARKEIGTEQKINCPPIRREYIDMDAFYDDLITTFFGEQFGMAFGASFTALTQHLPTLYPYPSLQYLGEDRFYDLIYVVTHIIYTHNHYGRYQLKPSDFPNEYQFLRKYFHVPWHDGDLETYAEFVDTLKSFGLSSQDEPWLGYAMTQIIKEQNADGSWGDIFDVTAYDRYHTTFNAIEAIRERKFELLKLEK